MILLRIAMSSRNLPPVRNLPHWSRIGSLSAPRPLPANHLQPLPAPPLADRRVVRGGGEGSPRSGMDTRVASLQRNIHFLQQQHKDTLEKLHAEIDDLRRENKELQYKLIMHPPKSCRKASTRSQRGTRPPTQGGEACTGMYLEQPLQDTRPSQDQTLRSMGESSEILGSSRQEHGPELRGGLITSLQPLRIQSGPTHPPRAPTLQECEVIIRQLYNANSVQSQEIVRVKAVLRDIVLSKKITPENFILTKAYLADSARKASEVERFPQLAPQTLPKKTSLLQRTNRLSQCHPCQKASLGLSVKSTHFFFPSSGPSQAGVILPALKQSLSSTIAERQRRTQAVQRNRLKRTVQ